MPSVYQKRGRYFVRWRDAAGRWQRKVTACSTKRDALREAQDLERQGERARLGLESLPTDGPRLTFGELRAWWWTDYGSKLRGKGVRPFFGKHLSSLDALPLSEITSARLEGLLVEREASLHRSRSTMSGGMFTGSSRSPPAGGSGRAPTPPPPSSGAKSPV